MKKTNKLVLAASTLLLGGAALVTVLTVVSNNTRQYKSDEGKNMNDNDGKDAGYLGQLEYFNTIRSGSKTGVVDINAEIKAQIDVANFSKNSKKAHSSNSTQSIGLNWTENGPENVGGRVRAILVDKNNHNRIFVGGVTGGLWISNDGGSTWAKYDDQLSNMCVTCITQSANGDIYFGTGEGGTYANTGYGSSGFIGGGIWKSTDDGNTFNVLPATVPAVNSNGGTWNTNFTKLASSPTDSNRIYAATIKGLYISSDAGNTWTIESATLSYHSDDVEVGSDGSVFVSISSACYTSPNGDIGTYTKVGNTLPGGSGFSLAIAPSDPNYLYASLTNSSGGLTGIYQSTDKGATWADIGPGGSTLFNPFAEPGSTSLSGQGGYDNIIAVYPNNKYKILLGGTTLYNWVQTNPSNPGVGQWTNITNYYGYPGYAYYAHPDQHAIVFDLTNNNTIYFGNDGGIYKSFDGGNTFAPYNKGLNITQNYSIAFQPWQNNGYGMMGGSQDNGTNYISGTSTPIQYASEINGGDGVDAEMSQLNEMAFYAGSPNSPILRSANEGASFAEFYSIRLAALQQPNFVIPTAMFESKYDSLSHDSINYVADKNYNAGDTIHTISPRNNNVGFTHVLTMPLDSDSTLQIQDPVMSKFVVGYSGANGVWMTVRPLDFTATPYWYQICSVSSDVMTMAFSPDGNHLFVGTDNGQIERVDSLSYILHSDAYPVHGVPFLDSVSGDISSAQHIEKTQIMGSFGQPITRIAVDPHDGNRIVVAMGQYGSASYIKYCNNALSSTPTFTSVQGNLPKMPIYAALITKDNPNEVIIGTEHGVWATTDITQGASTVWTQENNNEMPNCPVLMIRQQTLPYWWSDVNNSGMIYAGTHGRGMWSCDNYFHPYTTGVAENSITKTSVTIYPDPMVDNGTIAFTTNKSENVVMNFFDIQGRLVKTMNASTITGVNRIPFNVEELTAGTYLLSINGSTAQAVSRFVVVK